MTIGLNVAGSPDPNYDDYALDLLAQAGVRHVRLAWSPEAPGSFTERLLTRLIEAKYAVMVTLIPGLDEAKNLASDPFLQENWRLFVRHFAGRFGTSVDLIEIGNAPNRPKWSGYTPRSYLTAWRIAVEELESSSLKLAGPNVSDFEPFFNIAYLRGMGRSSKSPTVQTDNLFVERAVEPEAYDPSAMGRALNNVMRLNLAKKIYVLAEIGKRLNVQEHYCTYTCWTSKRIARWTDRHEQKGSDYLARYMLIAAASGHMQRLYWGPMIDSRDGLVDCGATDYPFVDNVAHYQRVRGTLQQFKVQRTFWTFKFFTALLGNARCQQALTNARGLHHLVFDDSQHIHHVLFAQDRRRFDLTALYPPQALAGAKARDVVGADIECFDGSVSETPVVLSWPKDFAALHTPNGAAVDALAPMGGKHARFGLYSHLKPVEVDSAEWRGVVNLALDAQPSLAEQLLPSALEGLQPKLKLRDKRNKLWTVGSPVAEQDLVIKLNRTTGARKLSYLFKLSKGLRHWNTANEMLRRGVPTPQPIAFFEQRSGSGLKPNYYICEHIADGFSARDVFAEFSRGAADYRGLSKAEWMTVLAGFVGHMHQRGMVHRDLSAGNLFIQMREGAPSVYAIDIGRAKMDSGISVLKDLQRICFKLSWQDREAFVRAYRAAHPKANVKRWRLACEAYDRKLTTKRALKRWLKFKASRRPD